VVDFAVHTYQHLSPLIIYLLVAAFLLLESSGIPLINTTLLLFTGAMAALGRLNLAVLMIVAISGSTLGACSAYALGRHYGEALLLRLARLLRIDAQKVLLAERWFQKAGGRMVFVSRIVPYIRPFSCFPAGISGMPLLRFLLAACSGSVIWCVTFLIVGWELGPRWKIALHLVHDYTLPAVGTLIALAVVYFFAQRRFARFVKKRLQVEEEETAQDHDLLEV
jgi:membrane protein DedA with SNARE-associated domain